MIFETVRILKDNFWAKGQTHRRILLVFTAGEESGFEGALSLASKHRELFEDIDFSFTVDGWLWGRWDRYEYPQTPYLAGVFKSKADSFKAKQCIATLEGFGKQRSNPVWITRDNTFFDTPIDALLFPSEANQVMFFHTPNHAVHHSRNRNNVGQLLAYVDVLVHIVLRLDSEYQKVWEEIERQELGAAAGARTEGSR